MISYKQEDALMQWLNEPPNWQQIGDLSIVKTAPKTDFWRITHYDFIRRPFGEKK